MTVAVAVGVLVAGAVFLLLTRGLVRIVLGLLILSHGVNLAVLAAGGTNRRGEAIGSELDPAVTADPLPQAFVLTAIVINFGITVYLLVLALVGRRDDDTEPDDTEPEETEPGETEPGETETEATR